MKKIMLIASVALFLFFTHHSTAHASEMIQSREQVALASQLFEMNMLVQQQEQAMWDSCTTFRKVWEESFFEADADLEASFSYYAKASHDEILSHPEAFSLVYSIASHYQHNNCTAIPGTFDVISRGEKLMRYSLARN